MENETLSTLDKNMRHYYLNVMGIQCWQLLDAPYGVESQNDVSINTDSDRDVAFTSYSQLEKTIQQCVKCSLHETRKQATKNQIKAGRGNPSADLMFVTLLPNANSGEANTLFGKMLAAISINIDDVYTSSLLKCSAPENYSVSEKEVQACGYYLTQQIKFIQPKILVVLGEKAARCLLQQNLSMDEFRAMNDTESNKVKNKVASIPLFISYSPEELLQQPESKRKAWSDLQQLQKILNSKM